MVENLERWRRVGVLVFEMRVRLRGVDIMVKEGVEGLEMGGYIYLCVFGLAGTSEVRMCVCDIVCSCQGCGIRITTSVLIHGIPVRGKLGAVA